jgi:hypothetical protein
MTSSKRQINSTHAISIITLAQHRNGTVTGKPGGGISQERGGVPPP